jgi:hypothetical protein
MAWLAPAASLIGSGLNFIQGQQQLGMQNRAISDAEQNQRVQGELNREQQDTQMQTLLRQWQLATAGQQDVYGNKLIFDPTTNSWVTATSPKGQELINRSDAIQRTQDVRNLTQGQTEQNLAYGRRLDQSAAASPLLTQFARGYGAPTREGVVGAQKVAAATGAGEAADIARSGVTMAALRGSGAIPNMNQTLAGLDRGAATGLRSSLAQDYSPVFQEMKSNYQGNLLNPYSSLASSASNTGSIPFSPSNIPTTLGSDMTSRASGAKTNVIPSQYPGYNINQSSNSLVNAMMNYKQPPLGGNAAAIGTGISDLIKSFGGGSSSDDSPWGPGGWENSSYNNAAYNNWRF